MQRAFVILFAAAGFVHAQTPAPSAWPFAAGSSTQSLANSTPPPQNPPLQEKTWAQLSQPVVSQVAANALQLKPEQWKHAETENFILHFRRIRDAHAVAPDIEFDLWFVAKQLGATKDQYARKSHVFIFKDEDEWQKFLATTSNPAWSHSFAHGDELFLDVREDSGAFDAENLAHETTHAIVARLYRGRRWPIWLNEGFAEYMGRASVAARHSQSVRRNQEFLRAARMTVAELTAVEHYPTDRGEVHELYETAEKFVRYLYNRYPPALFPKFVDHVIAGEPAATALQAVYGAEFNDMAAFERKFARFTR